MIVSKVSSLVTLLALLVSFVYVVPTESLNTIYLKAINPTSSQSHKNKRHTNATENTNASEITLEDYEYVIVGSGPGGSPLAARLALAGYKVLLIDAGGDYGNATVLQVPALHPFASEFTPITWDFFVHHYSDLEQQKKDSKMTYELPDGNYYVGLDPPEDATPLGISYPRTGTLGWMRRAQCANHDLSPRNRLAIHPECHRR